MVDFKKLAKETGEYQYNKIARLFAQQGWAMISTPHNGYGGYAPCSYRLWIVNKGEVEQLFYNLNYSRTRVIKNILLRNGVTGLLQVKEQVGIDVWTNYITNGYNTRRGLFANYNQDKVARMHTIARSHADYMEYEYLSSNQQHQLRVTARN